jgi:hypothetical protein
MQNQGINEKGTIFTSWDGVEIVPVAVTVHQLTRAVLSVDAKSAGKVWFTDDKSWESCQVLECGVFGLKTAKNTNIHRIVLKQRA